MLSSPRDEMFYLNSTLNFGIMPAFVFQLEVYYKADRLLTGLTAQQKGTTARWHSNKTSLLYLSQTIKFLKMVWLMINPYSMYCSFQLTLIFLKILSQILSLLSPRLRLPFSHMEIFILSV